MACFSLCGLTPDSWGLTSSLSILAFRVAATQSDGLSFWTSPLSLLWRNRTNRIYRYTEKEAYCEELAHTILERKESQALPSVSWRPGGLVVWASPSLKA